MEERNTRSSTATHPSETSTTTKGPNTIAKRLCMVGNVLNDPKNVEAANKLCIPVVSSETGDEFLQDIVGETVFVLEEFSGPIYDSLFEANHRILGPTALQQYAERGSVLPYNHRPLYCLAMLGVAICITGFRRKMDVARIMFHTHCMGGSMRNEMTSKVTHLVANTCVGDKYQYALAFGVPILADSWVQALWDQRADTSLSADNMDMSAHKLSVFHAARVCFVGFPAEERAHMTEVLELNGGSAAELGDSDLTIVVVDSGDTYSLLRASLVAPPTPRQAPPPDEFKTPTTTPRHTPDRRKSIADSIFKTPTLTRNFHRQSLSSFESRRNKSSPAETDSLKSRKHRFSMRMFKPRMSFGKGDNKPNLFDVSRIESTSDTVMLSEIPLPEEAAMEASPSDQGEEMDVEVTPRCSTPVETMPTRLETTPIRGYSTPTPAEATPLPGRVTPPFLGAVDEPAASEGIYHQQLTDAPVADLLGALPAQLRAPIVKAEWFWVSVQNEGCADEKDYLYEDNGDITSPLLTPSSRGARKRKRLREAAAVAACRESPAAHKRRSSVGEAALLSISGAYLDSTDDDLDAHEPGGSLAPRKALSPRHQVFLELLQTEMNYVNMLTLIMNAKQELDQQLQRHEAGASEGILNATEVKIIFGNLPPIYEVHTHMLADLKQAAAVWEDDTCVGRILLKYMDELTRAYPPFINFFEKSKDMLVKCDRERARFHAFLMGRQSRPDFCRQSVQDLLIRPVQRLPSISLLLNDILKHTGKSNTDHACLEKALSGIKQVMTHINEDKRRTEGQLKMFNIYNDIDNCPADIVSSHRVFITRCDVLELTDKSPALSGRGDHLVLFLFSDVLEVCKRRSRSFNAAKSPAASVKPLKHVRLMPLPGIKRIVDVRDSDECRNVFALMCRSNQELKERTYTFLLSDDAVDKTAFLNTLSRQTANSICKSDHRTMLSCLDASQLDIDTAGGGTLGKAFKFARSRLKVGRAFSFNKTPLKRAVSSMIHASPFSSTHLTPASQLAQLRLASCSNLNELGTPKPEETYVTPMSVQPTRKNKTVSQSLSVAALRRI